MKPFIAAVMTLLVLAGCTSSRTRLADQSELDRIKNELGIQACQARMDSVSFEIKGMLYHESLTEGNTPLMELLPDTLPVCPVSGLQYEIVETASDIIITCPSGHGSVTLEK